MRWKEDARKKDHLRLTTRAQRIFKGRCTFVPPLYFGSKNAASRPIVTRVSRDSSLFPDLFLLCLFLLSCLLPFVRYRNFSLSFGFSVQRLRAFALIAFQFVRVPFPFSINYLFFISFFLPHNSRSSAAVHPYVSLFHCQDISNHLPKYRWFIVWVSNMPQWGSLVY